MDPARSARLTSLVLIAILSACTSGGLQPTLSGGGNQGARDPDRHKSWINPAMKHGRLLYISDDIEQAVEVFTYPKLEYAGALTGFGFPQGECTNKAGDIWITDPSDADVLEYAHGGTIPIAEYQVTGPVGCAINPRTGDLAVTQGPDFQFVLIFPNANPGYSIGFTDSTFAYADFLGYDKYGDLFVDGLDASGSFVYAELPAGASPSSSFTNIILSTIPALPGGVQWDGHHMAVGDRGGNIYRISGATVVGTTTLNNACVFQFLIEAGRRVIAPSQPQGSACSVNADIYAYPAGGAPRKSLTENLEAPFGAAVSNE